MNIYNQTDLEKLKYRPPGYVMNPHLPGDVDYTKIWQKLLPRMVPITEFSGSVWPME